MKAFPVALISVLAAGCSDVGFGLKNHPGDCAVGIAWADCLPGTAGYQRGGGQQTRAIEAAERSAASRSETSAILAQCRAEMAAPELDPIRDKVELIREVADAPAPFSLAANDSFPTPAERVTVSRWATIREECLRRLNAVVLLPPGASALTVAVVQQLRNFASQAEGRVGALLVALYQAKLTYGEFAQARHEVGRDLVAAQTQLRAATAIADAQRQMEAQRVAQQEFQNNLMMWSAYTQAVNARQPQSIPLDTGTRLRTSCFSQKIGNFINTNCS